MGNPDNLAFKVLRSKYFPRGDPIMVNLRASSSYLWQSLIVGRDIIEVGSI